MSRQNKSLILRKKDDLAIEDRQIPQISDDQVLVKIGYTGICGSDVHYWTDGALGDFKVESPMILGHESSGVIEEVGKSVKSLKKGDRVALEPGIPCRSCGACKTGQYQLCPELVFAATPPHDGSLTGYYALAADFAYKLPENMSLKAGALMEPLSVAVHAVKRAMGLPSSLGAVASLGNNSVVIFGAGPIGLLVAAVCKAFCCAKVIMADLSEERLDFGKKYTNALTIMPKPPKDEEKGKLIASQRVAEQITEEGGLKHDDGSVGADLVFECTGAPPCIQAGVMACKSGGTFVQVGMGAQEVPFPITVMTREVNLKGSMRYGPGDYATAINLASSGRIDVEALVSHEFEFEKGPDAFKLAKEGKGIKIIIKAQRQQEG